MYTVDRYKIPDIGHSPVINEIERINNIFTKFRGYSGTSVYVERIGPGLHPLFDKAGGYFKNGAWVEVDFYDFIKLVFNCPPKTLKPYFTCVYMLASGLLFPGSD